jgi:predicted component of type VI protein secretion system
MPQLIFLTGTSAGRSMEFDRELILGRTDGDVIVADARVSRRHAAIRFEGSRAVVEDLGSANGTWVNEHRVQEPRVISPGDRIRLGNTSFEIQFDPVTASGSADVGAPPLAVPAVEPSPAEPFGALAALAVAPRQRARSRLIGPLVFSVAVTVATAIALVIYFAAR